MGRDKEDREKTEREKTKQPQRSVFHAAHFSSMLACIHAAQREDTNSKGESLAKYFHYVH